MPVLRRSVILGAAVAGALLIGPVAGALLMGPAAWADPGSGGTGSVPAPSGTSGPGTPTPPPTPPTSPTPPTPTTPPDSTAPATTAPAPSPPATSSPAPPATSGPATPTAPPTTTPPGGGVTGTAVTDCSTQQVVFTVVNGTGQAITAAVAVPGGSPFRTLPVPAGEQRVIRQAPGAGPFQYVLAQLEPTRVLATVDGSFPCPQRQDQSIPAASGEPTSVPGVCAVALFLTGAGPAHGRVTVTGGTGFTYTPDAGYVGPDQFDYTCLASEGMFGTVFVQVHAAATAAPTQPGQPTQAVQPVQPTEAPPSVGPLASTGNDTSRVARAGAAFVLAGGLLLSLLALTRRRS